MQKYCYLCSRNIFVNSFAIFLRLQVQNICVNRKNSSSALRHEVKMTCELHTTNWRGVRIAHFWAYILYAWPHMMDITIEFTTTVAVAQWIIELQLSNRSNPPLITFVFNVITSSLLKIIIFGWDLPLKSDTIFRHSLTIEQDFSLLCCQKVSFL